MGMPHCEIVALKPISRLEAEIEYSAHEVLKPEF